MYKFVCVCVRERERETVYVSEKESVQEVNCKETSERERESECLSLCDGFFK